LRVALLAAPVSLILAACGGAVTDLGSPDGGTHRGDGGPDPACKGVMPGATCSVRNQVCNYPGTTSLDCEGQPIPISCSCDGTWTCESPVMPDCTVPGPSCPEPSLLKPKSSCSLDGQQCNSTIIPYQGCDGQTHLSSALCTCSGNTWACPQPVTPPCAPPTCPDPKSVLPYQQCHGEEGLQCAGNPSYCQGKVFYDALQCENGYWYPIATTICDSPFLDATVYDVGPSFDAGFPDAYVVYDGH
jgi:hypothetical protein